MDEELSQPTKHASKIIILKFFIMKATQSLTHKVVDDEIGLSYQKQAKTNTHS